MSAPVNFAAFYAAFFVRNIKCSKMLFFNELNCCCRLKRWVIQTVLPTRRDDCIAKQTRDGHGPDTARHRGDRTGHL